MSESEQPSKRKVKREQINIFRIGSLWYFKHFFDDREIFQGLADYYNRGRYRFELKSIGERDTVMKYLEEKGFEPIPIEDTCDYTVKIDRFKKHAAILKNSVDVEERGNDKVFVMKDLASVEEAIEQGAERANEEK